MKQTPLISRVTKLYKNTTHINIYTVPEAITPHVRIGIENTFDSLITRDEAHIIVDIMFNNIEKNHDINI